MPRFGRKRAASWDGGLPEDGTVELAGVRLTGRRVSAEGARGPVAWRTEDEVPVATWSALAAAHGHTGLWPVLVEPLGGDPSRDGLTDAMAPPTPPDLDATTAEEVLRGWWEDPDEEDDEAFGDLAPHGRRFPGLAPAARASDGPIELDGVEPAPLALVEVARPADVLAATRWSGPLNHDHDVWKLSVVLRSWEERFGVLPVVLGFDTLELAVRRPPAEDETVAVAAELFAFCPDLVWQGAGSLQALAAGLQGATRWAFWWD